MRKHLPLLSALLMTGFASQSMATQDILSVTTKTTSGTSSSAEGYTYEGSVRQITSFSTSTNSYGVASMADNVFIRRNAVNPNQSSVWYTSSGTGTNLSGVHDSSYGQMLLGNNLFSGSDNTFANNSTPAATAGNIERLDFTWNSPLTVNNSFAFAVFERGDVGVHDSFAIAAILAVDGAGNPTAFGSLLKVAAGWGATNPIANMDYRLFRYSNGDNIGATTDSTGVANQGIGGLLISAADLNLITGAKIYGYALMAADVTATNSTQLLDWTNSTFYPTTTDGATGGGGIDLASINGIAFTVVPEMDALLPLLLFGGVFAGCQWRRMRSKVKATL